MNKLNLLKTKLKNPVIASSILSLIFIVLNEVNIINLSNSQIDKMITIILSILISIGVLTNSD